MDSIFKERRATTCRLVAIQVTIIFDLKETIRIFIYSRPALLYRLLIHIYSQEKQNKKFKYYRKIQKGARPDASISSSHFSRDKTINARRRKRRRRANNFFFFFFILIIIIIIARALCWYYILLTGGYEIMSVCLSTHTHTGKLSIKPQVPRCYLNVAWWSARRPAGSKQRATPFQTSVPQHFWKLSTPLLLSFLVSLHFCCFDWSMMSFLCVFGNEERIRDRWGECG